MAESPHPAEADTPTPPTDAADQVADELRVDQPERPDAESADGPTEDTIGIRGDDPHLSDFVLSMTKAMNRTGYYSTQHPEGQRALLGLFDSFVNLMHERGPEFSFQLSFSREGAGDEDVALYDGKQSIKLMREVLTEGAANTFVPKLVEYFHRQGLLSFSIKKEIPQDHFEIFVERMTRPQDQQTTHPGEELSRDLAAAGVRTVSVVFDEDRIQGIKGSIPWRAELALTRLRKDLRMIPMLANASVEEMRQIKSRLMDDILRGIQQVNLLIALARHLGEALSGQEDIMPRDEAELHLVNGIGTAILPNVAEQMAQPWLHTEDQTDENPEDRRCRARLIQHTIHRLLESTEKKAAHALVVFYEHGYLDLDALSQRGRDVIRASALAEAAMNAPEKLISEMNHEGSDDPFGLTIRDLELAVEELLERKEWDTAAALTKTVWQYAKGDLTVPEGGAEIAFDTLGRLATEEVTVGIAGGITAPDGPYEGCVELLRMLEPEPAVDALLVVLEDTDNPTLRLWAVDEINKRAWDCVDKLVAIIQEPKTPWHVLRNLLTVIRKVGTESAYTAVAQLFEHNKHQVRSEALITMAELAPGRAMRLIERGLDDEDHELRRTAALAAATSPKPSDIAIRLLIRIMTSDREKEGTRLQAAAALGAIASRVDNPGRRETILDGMRTVISDKYGSRMHRFKRFAASRLPPPPFLLAALCQVLGAVGTGEDQALLAACLDDENREVREAASHAMGRLRATSSPPPPNI